MQCGMRDAERMMSVDQRCRLSLCFVDEMSNVSGTLAIVANSNRIMQHSYVMASDIVLTEVQIPLQRHHTTPHDIRLYTLCRNLFAS